MRIKIMKTLYELPKQHNKTINDAIEDLDLFSDTLTNLGVTVHRPNIHPHYKTIKSPF